jgi:inosine-uridine nucleoside N-ribohydrolase
MKIFSFWGLWAGCAAVFVGSVCGAQSGLAQGDAHAQTVPSQTGEPVILDTDIGDDIDDAYALALALKSPEIHLFGITTAFGDTELRARLVDRFLTAAEIRDVQDYVGLKTQAGNVFTQAAYARQSNPFSVDLCRRFFGTSPTAQDRFQTCEREHQDAVGFILRSAQEHPGEITLIAIGPLFNVEEAIKRDPATFRKLKRVVIMGGSIDRGYDGRNGERRPPDAEWNINRDPAGLRALLASGVPVFMMPLDSTQIHLETKEREAIFAHGSPLTDQLTMLYHQWKAGTDGHPDAPTLFDPVAVTYAIRPELCPVVPMRIEVDDRGFTRKVDGPANAQVCLKSDEAGFLDLLLSRLVGDSAH